MKFNLTFLLILLNLSVFSQKYHPLIKNNYYWDEEWITWTPWGFEHDQYRSFFDNDTFYSIKTKRK